MQVGNVPPPIINTTTVRSAIHQPSNQWLLDQHISKPHIKHSWHPLTKLLSNTYPSLYFECKLEKHQQPIFPPWPPLVPTNIIKAMKYGHLLESKRYPFGKTQSMGSWMTFCKHALSILVHMHIITIYYNIVEKYILEVMILRYVAVLFGTRSMIYGIGCFYLTYYVHVI